MWNFKKKPNAIGEHYGPVENYPFLSTVSCNMMNQLYFLAGVDRIAEDGDALNDLALEPIRDALQHMREKLDALESIQEEA